jgi:hypothetical protein
VIILFIFYHFVAVSALGNSSEQVGDWQKSNALLQKADWHFKRVISTDVKHALRYFLEARKQHFRFGTLLLPMNQNLSKKLQRQIQITLFAKKYNINID